MPFNANEFRKQLKNGGARPNQFKIELMTAPSSFTSAAGSGNAMSSFTYMTNAADLPGSVIGTIPVPYFGRFINVAGDRMFEDWTCAIYCDEDFIIRNAFEAWNNSMSFLNFDTFKEHGASAETTDKYTSNIKVSHYTKTGKVDKIYILHNAFPYVVSPVQLSWQANDQVMMFEVTWKYDYFTTNFNAYNKNEISTTDVDASARRE